ncbi:MAG TPA: Nramp family divalent metal transporter, partial [Methylocystis sp.]|nr:Nramp family divalent metal transporter [Methylocystis sp.]
MTKRTLSEQAIAVAAPVLAGERRGHFRAYAALAGPAVIASIAYMDPGNFATNIAAGAGYGYRLLWVVLFANLIAMLFQALSAKLGVVTGKNLAELCREQFPTPAVWCLWGVSEVAAMATDLAELVGAGIGVGLLFHIPLIVAMMVAAVASYGVLMLDQSGFRPIELVIGALVAVIGLCYVIELIVAPVDWGAAAQGLVTPWIGDASALGLAVAIIGATVMPHALFLHSGLTQARMPLPGADARRRLLRFSNREVVIALSAAGLVNMAMVVMAASAFHAGHSGVGELDGAFHTLAPLLGSGAAFVFLASLIASGVSSSVVGTMAGQMIMQGFVGFRIPIWVRRIVTMAPAFAVIALGANATQAMVLSQIVLSLTLPVPMIALLIFTRRADVMGAFANGDAVNAAAALAATAVLGFNAVLLWQAL